MSELEWKNAGAPKLGELKGRAQLLKPMIRLGQEGVSGSLVKAINEALDQHELVKVKFMAYKERKKELARTIEEQTGANLVLAVGHTATYYRAKKSA
jgi:RNA-binding protein